MSPFLYNVTLFCLACLFIAAAMCLYRIYIGPRAADRAVGFDSLTMSFMGIVCLMCILYQQHLYFDAVWILTVVGFIGSVAVAKYIERGRVF